MTNSTKNNCIRAINAIKKNYCEECGLAICPHDCEWYKTIMRLRNGSGNNPLELESQISVNTRYSHKVIREHIRESLAEKGLLRNYD